MGEMHTTLELRKGLAERLFTLAEREGMSVEELLQYFQRYGIRGSRYNSGDATISITNSPFLRFASEIFQCPQEMQLKHHLISGKLRLYLLLKFFMLLVPAFEAIAGRGFLLLFLFTTIVRDNIKAYQQWILIYP